MDAERTRWPVLFACGFRPMFLGCGLVALLALPAWIAIRAAGLAPWGAMPPSLWHAHEMLFGFAFAAIAGFLATAVPNWTGTPFTRGAPLAALAVLWVAARALLVAGPAAGVAWWLAVLVELSVVPALVALVAPPLLRTRNRNRVMLAALGALWLADAAFLWAVSRGEPALASRTLLAALDLVLLMVTIVGGRIIPTFTANALRRDGVAVAPLVRPWLETALPALMALGAVADVAALAALPAALLAALLAVLHALRLAGWQGLRTRREPILWSLHLAYAWLPAGFALKAAWLAAGAGFAAFWLHALAVGAVAGMVLAVATRVALGHTGRPLRVHGAIALAYALLSLSAVARVLLPHAGLPDYDASLLLAAALWTAAFLVFVVVYAPILARPRIDGKPG